MRIGGMGNIYPTFIYNPNTVSARSMNRLSKISDDVLDKKVDYSEVEAQENQNPLRKGQTLDFEGILAKQMQQGQNRAARIMGSETKPVEETSERTDALFPEEGERTETVSRNAQAEAASKKTVKGMDTEDKNRISVMQMQRAMEAYGMFMTA
ncbi:MAG: hypothetical protein K2P65_07315 [Lachnospiraceae bacterium]|nr:hypothetical protein [Lachnospiraceae bacterium]